MQIRVISTKEEIGELSADERIVHCAFRPNYKDVHHILDMCPKLEAIQIPKSYYDTIAETVTLLLKDKKVELIEGDVQGHRKDVSAYYTVPSKVIEKIKEMKVLGAKEYEIVEAVNKMYVLRPNTVSFLVRTVKA
jgi:hypothetical protein